MTPENLKTVKLIGIALSLVGVVGIVITGYSNLFQIHNDL